MPQRSKNIYQGSRIVRRMRQPHTTVQFERALAPTVQNGQPAYLRYAQPGRPNKKRTNKEYLVMLMRIVNSLPEKEISKQTRAELLDFLDRMQTALQQKRRKADIKKLPRLQQMKEDMRNTTLEILNDSWQSAREIYDQLLEIVGDDIPEEYLSIDREVSILIALRTENLLESKTFKDEKGKSLNYYRIAQKEIEE